MMIMPKKSKNEKMVRIDLTIEENQKEAWKQYATKKGIPLARMIKEIVDMEVFGTKTESEKIGVQFDRIEKMIRKDFKEQAEDLRKLRAEIAESTKLKMKEVFNSDSASILARILDLLRVSEMKRDKIESILNLDKKTVRTALAHLESQGLVGYNAENDTWGVINE